MFTIALRLFKGSTRTFLLAGLALNVIFSPVKGLMPSRAFVAGFFTTFSFMQAGHGEQTVTAQALLDHAAQ